MLRSKPDDQLLERQSKRATWIRMEMAFSKGQIGVQALSDCKLYVQVSALEILMYKHYGRLRRY